MSLGWKLNTQTTTLSHYIYISIICSIYCCFRISLGISSAHTLEEVEEETIFSYIGLLWDVIPSQCYHPDKTMQENKLVAFCALGVIGVQQQSHISSPMGLVHRAAILEGTECGICTPSVLPAQLALRTKMQDDHLVNKRAHWGRTHSSTSIYLSIFYCLSDISVPLQAATRTQILLQR